MIRYPGHAATGSQCPAPSGGWLTLVCPTIADADDYPDEGNGQPALEYATEFGCSNPVSIVPNQSSDPATRYDQMLAACNTPDGDVGNRRIWDAWRAILGEEITLPVICGVPPCSSAVTIGSGDTARHRVQRFAGVTVCGFHFSSNNQRHGETTRQVRVRARTPALEATTRPRTTCCWCSTTSRRRGRCRPVPAPSATRPAMAACGGPCSSSDGGRARRKSMALLRSTCEWLSAQSRASMMRCWSRATLRT